MNSIAKSNLTADEKASKIVEYADDMKAMQIENIDVRKKTSVTERIVICTGTSDTHVKAIAEKVVEKLKAEGIRSIRRNAGPKSDGWVLFDFGDVVFHVFLEEKRAFYDLESLWNAIPEDPDIVS